MLAWLRTGLAATAVAIAVGKIVPDLSKNVTIWPYTVLGVGYGLLGVALILYTGCAAAPRSTRRSAPGRMRRRATARSP